MRTIEDHKVNPANDALTIAVLDEPSHGGACHLYHIHRGPHDPAKYDDGIFDPEVFCPVATLIAFQNGPIAEFGVNGLTHEVLLAILADRLRGFQSGPYACQENAIALHHVCQAQAVLQRRTRARMERGVEGTHQL